MPSSGERAPTILVVDDQPSTGAVIEAGLLAAGYRVTLRESGASALEAFRAQPADLVLLDILMPGLDGFETLRQLRGLPAGDQTPVVFLTALHDPATHGRALASGADDLLSKPVNRTELLMRVRSLLWVRRLRDELAAQRDALLEAHRQKEQLTALLVHDFKSPLATILAGADYLGRERALSPDVRDCVGDIEQAAGALERMTLNLLDISRSEDGALETNRCRFEGSELAQATCARLVRRAESRQIRLLCDAEVALPLEADRDFIRRVLENLLDNALGVAPVGTTVRLEARQEKGAALLRVSDEGPGVPPAWRERIFEKYVRLESGNAESARNGRWLGLTFCRLAIHAHGGAIWVEENHPLGSVFCVRLPLAP
ncbi:MAG: response regulator [Deltaproteobacteria bacterium]|nr:response regulator [Deltaproteobacteria bacterium]